MREQWEKDLQSRLGDYRKKAPEGLLADIKKEMAQRGICPSSAEAHCLVLPMWLKAVAAVVVIVERKRRNTSATGPYNFQIERCSCWRELC
jgi:hypothetical protein